MKLYKLLINLVECDGDSEMVIADAEIGDYLETESSADAAFDLVLDALSEKDVYSKIDKLNRKRTI